MACCESLSRLRESDYIDNGKIYLQRVGVPTNFPNDLRNYNFCVNCGQELKFHSEYPFGICLAFRNGKLNGKIEPRQSNNPTAARDQYLFNLNRREEVEQYRLGDNNYPEPISIDYCPYCGKKINE
jgi:hypothetical protein